MVSVVSNIHLVFLLFQRLRKDSNIATSRKHHQENIPSKDR